MSLILVRYSLKTPNTWLFYGVMSEFSVVSRVIWQYSHISLVTLSSILVSFLMLVSGMWLCEDSLWSRFIISNGFTSSLFFTDDSLEYITLSPFRYITLHPQSIQALKCPSIQWLVWYPCSYFFLLYSWCSFIRVAGITEGNSVFSEEWKWIPFPISSQPPNTTVLTYLDGKGCLHKLLISEWDRKTKQNKTIISLYFLRWQQIPRSNSLDNFSIDFKVWCQGGADVSSLSRPQEWDVGLNF